MHILSILLLILAELLSYLIFCKGFFPTKVLLTPEELARFNTEPPKGFKDPPRQFDRVVFMLVDAMRADFVFSQQSHMKFAQQLINDGNAIGFTAYSNPPTVTLPRLKGITTGSIPNFIDAVLNIAEDDTSSTLGDQDSWVKQMIQNNWNIHMFGDDTWLKLFPGYFSKSDGTSSFYVSDYTIVDHNVTRHLPEELSDEGLDQWNCMILHYLGLDHIGHKGGPQSANMPGKQVELDSVVKQIFNGLLKDDPNTLMVLLGDHGMNDAGNHGGSSVGEVSSGMVLISSKFGGMKKALSSSELPLSVDPSFNYLQNIDQIDLVPTLAELTGLNVPINSLGTFIPSLLPLYHSSLDRCNVLIKNALQLKVLLDKSHSDNSLLPLDHYCNVSSEQELTDYIVSAKRELSETSSDYNYHDLHLGIALYLLLTIISIFWFAYHYRYQPILGVTIITFFITYGLSFIGSSLIEEEHHIWWFFTTIFSSYLIQHSPTFWPSLSLLISLRILKAWNNSGQKYNSSEYLKIASYLSSLAPKIGPNVFAFLLLLTFLPFFISKVKIHFGAQQTLVDFVEFVSLSMMTFILMTIKMLSFLTSTYNLDVEDTGLQKIWLDFIDWLRAYSALKDFNSISNQLFRLFHYVWFICAIGTFLKSRISRSLHIPMTIDEYTRNILVLFTYLSISQTNFINVPLYGVMYFVYLGFNSLVPKVSGLRLSSYLSLFTILLQNLSFFQFGSTNSLASVDLTNSFNGLTSYNMILSGVLTFVANWAAPIFWSVVYTVMSLDALPRGACKWNCLYDRMIFNLTFYSLTGLLLIGSCYNLRFHLFIWTVFSPKLLYYLAWLGCNLVADFAVSAIVIGASETEGEVSRQPVEEKAN
ncbi:DEKNAAC105380 [Brettanomyces naardenensis]|uniref:GPI ethanolamine phosphate transferase 2 n=1 Tax=Brettanomyces naardenensis TaxID=13370 RepID=A0A448YTE1_BRENA|nr:DEKNAAC105380 [Brettanomyces naardenensis]